MERERNKRFKESMDREGKEGRVDKGEGEREKEGGRGGRAKGRRDDRRQPREVR